MDSNRTYFYARVSTAEQNLDRQLEAFKNMGAEDRSIISDKASGKNLDRPGYQALKTTLLRPGDTLVIKSLDRLSRNKEHIKNELEYFKLNNIRLKVLDLPTTMVNLSEGQEWIFEMINNILIEVISSIAEQERITIKRRQREGIEAAKKNGRHLGRKKITYPCNWNEYYDLWKNGKISAMSFMKAVGLKKTTFYRLASEYENNEMLYKI